MSHRTIRRRWEANPDRMPPFGHPLAFDYDAFIPATIADLAWPVPLALAGELEAVALELARFQGSATLAGLEALARQLLRSESIGSSRIEGLALSQRRLARALVDPGAEGETARAIAGNIAAMAEAIQLGTSGEAPSLMGILQLHATLMAATSDAELGGKLRTTQNWIGGHDWSPQAAEFIPPPEDEVARLLEDLVAFMGRTDLPAVLQAAIAHAQFETIHPFADGNGRVGRALIHTILTRRGLTPTVVPPVSLVLATNATRYVEGLTAYREGDIAGWATFFTRALASATDHAADLAARLGGLQAHWRERLGHPRSHSAVERLLQQLPAQPVLDLHRAMEAAGASEEAARRALVELEAKGILATVQVGKKRNRIWEARELLQLLDAFEWTMAKPTRPGEPRRPAPGRGE